jgi:hypothetical protein
MAIISGCDASPVFRIPRLCPHHIAGLSSLTMALCNIEQEEREQVEDRITQ